MRQEPLPGTTTLEGSTPFSAIDFRRAKDVFSLLKLETGGQTYPAALRIKGLTLLNLPYSPVGSGNGGSIRALSALLWIAKVPEARTMDMQPIYIVEGVTVAVTCTEVHFLRSFLQRLHQNTAHSDKTIVELEVRALVALPLLQVLCGPQRAVPVATGARTGGPSVGRLVPEVAGCGLGKQAEYPSSSRHHGPTAICPCEALLSSCTCKLHRTAQKLTKTALRQLYSWRGCPAACRTTTGAWKRCS